MIVSADQVTCQHTARAASDGRLLNLARVEFMSPPMAVYWITARALDVGVQLDHPGLQSVWGEIRATGHFPAALAALSAGRGYELEMTAEGVVHQFTAVPAGVSNDSYDMAVEELCASDPR